MDAAGMKESAVMENPSYQRIVSWWAFHSFPIPGVSIGWWLDPIRWISEAVYINPHYSIILSPPISG